MCVLSIKVPIRKKSGNLFNDPRIFKKIKRLVANLKALPPELHATVHLDLKCRLYGLCQDHE